MLAGEAITVQKWNSPQGVQVHYTNAAAAEASIAAGGLYRVSSLSYFK